MQTMSVSYQGVLVRNLTGKVSNKFMVNTSSDNRQLNTASIQSSKLREILTSPY